ncbi:MAG: hypothetical protein AB4911_00245 [Oscillochloridaceae bacterium umkhey_bin13]
MKYSFTLTTDHFQFFLADEGYRMDTSTIWGNEALERQVASGFDLLAVGTARYGGETHVVIDILDAHFEMSAGFLGNGNTYTLHVYSGVLLLFSPESDIRAVSRINIVPGVYRVIVAFDNLDSVKDEEAFSGEDMYRLALQRDNE